LIYFLDKAEFLPNKCEEIFEIFENLLNKKYFNYFDENLLLILTKYILNFSFQITNSVIQHQQAAFSSSTEELTFYFVKPLNKQQQNEIKSCIELIERLVDQLTTTSCINHVVLCLCELLDVTYQSQLNKSDYQVNRVDSQMASINDTIIGKIYECMNKLFISPIGNCAIFTFFTEIFPLK
jgi:hypothetical protein